MRAPGALLAALLLAGCSGLLAGCSGEPAPPAARGDAQPPQPSQQQRRVATLDGVRLSLEVADDEAERSVGLMRRTSVPPGTGMVFLYDQPSTGAFYMYDVPIPLRAVFVRDGTVVFSVLMPPCREAAPQDCPTYGPDEPYDTVVETAPETLPDVQPGDRLVLEP